MDNIKKIYRTVINIFRKYNYNDSGLGYTTIIQNMKNYREKHEVLKEVEENRKKTNIRYFPEFNNVTDKKDIMVSIEYW